MIREEFRLAECPGSLLLHLHHRVRARRCGTSISIWLTELPTEIRKALIQGSPPKAPEAAVFTYSQSYQASTLRNFIIHGSRGVDCQFHVMKLAALENLEKQFPTVDAQNPKHQLVAIDI